MDLYGRAEKYRNIFQELDLMRLHELVSSGRLDDYYLALEEGEKWLDQVAKLHQDPAFFDEIREIVSKKRNDLLRFYQKYFLTHRILGDADAMEAPDIICLLAHKDFELMRKRVEGAVPCIRKHPDSVVLLCGGGFDPGVTEAEIMRESLKTHGLERGNILLETDSIDTIANAVFAKLRLRLAEKLPGKGSLLIITSAFHATRALNIFRRVFGPDYKVAARPVRTTQGDLLYKDLAAHELRSEDRSTSEIFGMADPVTDLIEPVTPGDEITVFYQLIMHHDFYRHRYDLVRKYAAVLGKKPQHEAKTGKREVPVRWQMRFVPFGTDLKGRMPRGAVALDVGSGLPEENIFDHHHLPEEFKSAASLVYSYGPLILERMEKHSPGQIIMHQSPDLDCCVSAFLVWALIEQPTLWQASYVRSLVDFCSCVEQGDHIPDTTLTLYSLSLLLPDWLNSEPGKAFLNQNQEEFSRFFEKKGLCTPSFADRDAWSLSIIFCLLQHAAQSMDSHADAALQSNNFPPPFQGIIDDLQILLERQIHGCEQEWRRAIENQWAGRIVIPDRNGNTHRLPYIRVLDPKSSPGLLCKYLYSKARLEYGVPVVVITQDTVSNRTVISIDPKSGYHLKGLGLYLEEMENQREAEHGISDVSEPRFWYLNQKGNKCPDPLFPSNDPWYDGRGHNYTIVDTPGSGTLLALEEVYNAVATGKWQEKAEKYEGKMYQDWLAGLEKAAGVRL